MKWDFAKYFVWSDTSQQWFKCIFASLQPEKFLYEQLISSKDKYNHYLMCNCLGLMIAWINFRIKMVSDKFINVVV